MKPVLKEMIRIYKPKGIDWLGYKLTANNPYTFHHIIKKEHFGSYDMTNGAIITSIPHGYLHIIEYKDYEIYLYLNMILKMINIQCEYPTKQQLLAIDDLLRTFEREHSSDKSKKGKKLIEYEYYDRIQTEWKK